MKKEQVIVSLTTWSKRIANLPVVLDSIYTQTYLPDKVVLNLAFGETIPEDVDVYLKKHEVEVAYVEDTKVYKKFLPTLKKYPNACIVCIDDDFVYPNTMIADFMDVHQQYPNYPISGNRDIIRGRKCHCGCASLLKAEYFGEYINKIDNEVMRVCESSDIVYTYFATLNGHPYICTHDLYFTNMESYNSVCAYSNDVIQGSGIMDTFDYLEIRFGSLPDVLASYAHDVVPVDVVMQIIDTVNKEKNTNEIFEAERRVRSTRTYRLGKTILSPFRWFKRIVCKK